MLTDRMKWNLLPDKHNLLTSRRGFSLVEVLVASGIGLLSFGIISMALVGFQYSASSTVSQLNSRFTHHDALRKIGRLVMESTRVTVQVIGERQIIHLWHDDQAVWTPGKTEDDTEGILFLEPEEGCLVYAKDVNSPEVIEVLAEGIESVSFQMTGNALFAEMKLEYDPHTPGSERYLRASYMTRNNPKSRENASQ